MKLATILVLLLCSSCAPDFPQKDRFKIERVSFTLRMVTDLDTGAEYLYYDRGGIVKLEKR